jgi:phosphoribosylformylglycinamidine synthase subunit PurS
MKARVVVTLKEGILDPQGNAIEGALKSLGIAGIDSVRQGKIFEIELATNDPIAAEELLRGACEKLLANQVVEDFEVELR